LVYTYIYIYVQWNPASTTTHWTPLIGHVSMARVVALVDLITLAFLKVSRISFPNRPHRTSHLSVNGNIKLQWAISFFKNEKN